MTFMKTLTAASAVALGLVAGAAHAATTTGSSADFGPIADNSEVTQTVEITDNLIITDVNVKIFGLNSTWVGDLIISLFSPDATRVDILCSAGSIDCVAGLGDSSNLSGDYLFDDEAATNFLVAVDAIVSGDILDDGVPYSGAGSAGVNMGLLSAFDGEMSAGTWSMTIRDDQPGDATSALNFRLDITGDVAAVPLPASLPLLAGGLALIGWNRRRKS